MQPDPVFDIQQNLLMAILPVPVLLSFLAVACVLVCSGRLAGAREVGTDGANFSNVELGALHDLFSATNGDDWQWKNESTRIPWNFTSDANPCLDKWQGVSCVLPPPYDTYHVSNLSLWKFNLQGTLPGSMSNLSYLEVLDLHTNMLFGVIPEQLATVPALQSLDFSYNSLSGRVPTLLCGQNMTYLLLANNYLTGTIPIIINCTGLVAVTLSNNRFSGTIPAGLGNNHKLELIEARYNRFKGTIPQELGQLQSLKTLYLSHNDLQGSLPVSLANLTELMHLDVSNNMLTGSLEGCFNATTQSQLIKVLLHDNAFTGTLPESVLSNKRLRYLYLDNNCFSGRLSDSICGSQDLEELSLGGLGSSVVCVARPFTFISDSFVLLQSVRGHVPTCVFELPKLRGLILVNNEFSGTIPTNSLLGANLSQIVLSHNSFSGSVPSTI